MKEVLVGMGHQVVRLVSFAICGSYRIFTPLKSYFSVLGRVSIERGLTYLFMTRSIEKSRELLCTLEVVDSCGKDDGCSLKR